MGNSNSGSKFENTLCNKIHEFFRVILLGKKKMYVPQMSSLSEVYRSYISQYNAASGILSILQYASLVFSDRIWFTELHIGIYMLKERRKKISKPILINYICNVSTFYIN